MYWKNSKNYNSLLLILFIYSTTLVGQKIDTLIINLDTLSSEDSVYTIKCNIPKIICGLDNLKIPIKLKGFNKSSLYVIDNLKGNGDSFFSKKNTNSSIIIPSYKIFSALWILNENFSNIDCNKNRQKLSCQIFFSIHKSKQKIRYLEKRIKIKYNYIE